MLILGSSSPHRLALLTSAGITPTKIISPDIDETPLRKEKPGELASRLSLLKAQKVACSIKGSAYIIGADTVVGTKARIFEKAENAETIRNNLIFFSGRKILINSAVTVLRIEDSGNIKSATRLVTSSVKFKRLSQLEIEYYLNTGIGIGIAGGVEIQGFGQALFKNITGSYSGIIGLPLYETFNLLHGLGYDLFKSKG